MAIGLRIGSTNTLRTSITAPVFRVIAGPSRMASEQPARGQRTHSSIDLRVLVIRTAFSGAFPSTDSCAETEDTPGEGGSK